MGSEFERVCEQLEELDRQLQEVRLRLDRLESRQGDRVAGPGEAPVHGGRGPPSGEPAADSAFFASGVALVGRTLVVLGGAYLFRAVTDRALVPPLVGVGAALLYAVFWLWRCDRDAARGRRTSALFHGFTSALITYPLLWETTAVFGLLTPAVACGALVGVLAFGTAVAVRREMTPLAWTVGLAHLVTALALMFGTQAFLPAALALLAGSAIVELPWPADRWPLLRWPVGLGSDAGLAVLAGASVSRLAQEPIAAGVVPALVALPLLYGAAVTHRTLHRGQTLSAFGVLQLVLALAVGLGGAARVLTVQGASAAPIGALAVLAGAAAYVTAFAFVDRRQGRGCNFYAFSSLGALLVLAGSALVLGTGSAALAGLWGILSLAAVGLGVRFDRITLRFHGVVYAWAAALASGLLAAAVDGLLAEPAAWRPLPGMALVVGAVGLCGAAVLFAAPRRDAPVHTYLPQAVLAALLVAVVAGLASRGLAALSLGALAEADLPAALAALRSVLLAGLALLLAAAARYGSFPELHWVVYALLVLGAAKLLWEDLRVGEPMALFVALAAYGGALIATSRLLRGGKRPADA